MLSIHSDLDFIARIPRLLVLAIFEMFQYATSLEYELSNHFMFSESEFAPRTVPSHKMSLSAGDTIPIQRDFVTNLVAADETGSIIIIHKKDFLVLHI